MTDDRWQQIAEAVAQLADVSYRVETDEITDEDVLRLCGEARDAMRALTDAPKPDPVGATCARCGETCQVFRCNLSSEDPPQVDGCHFCPPDEGGDDDACGTCYECGKPADEACSQCETPLHHECSIYGHCRDCADEKGEDWHGGDSETACPWGIDQCANLGDEALCAECREWPTPLHCTPKGAPPTLGDQFAGITVDAPRTCGTCGHLVNEVGRPAFGHCHLTDEWPPKRKPACANWQPRQPAPTAPRIAAPRELVEWFADWLPKQVSFIPQTRTKLETILALLNPTDCVPVTREAWDAAKAILDMAIACGQTCSAADLAPALGIREAWVAGEEKSDATTDSD